MTTSRQPDASYHARIMARRMRDPEFAAAYREALERIATFDTRVRAAIETGRLPTDWENWSPDELELADRIGEGSA